jgi:hypothetical protein
MTIQATLSDDGRPAEAFGFKPSSDSRGSETIQKLLTDDGRPAEAFGFKPFSDSRGSEAINYQPFCFADRSGYIILLHSPAQV